MNTRKSILVLTVIIALSLGICGCRTVPYSGRTQFLVTSEAQEIALGDQAWKEVMEKEQLDTNSLYNQALERVGTNISRVVNKPDYNWEFRVFKNKVPNAFCLPGGKVGVYSGLFDYAANDAELAAVVGHEIGHAIARHGGERMSQGAVQQVGAELIKAGSENNENIMLAYGVATNVGAILPYSRTHEYEADYMGLIFMAKAGYDPRAAITFWEKFGKLSQTNKFTEFFSTHPGGENRINDLKEKLAEAINLYQKAPVKRGLGVIYRK
jgi:predicted Zn-dependent protease